MLDYRQDAQWRLDKVEIELTVLKIERSLLMEFSSTDTVTMKDAQPEKAV